MMRTEETGTGGSERMRKSVFAVDGRMAAHWAILVLCVVQLPTSAAIHRTHQVNPFGLPPSAFDLLLHQVHAWSGWSILALAAGLFVLRTSGRLPPLPVGMPAWQTHLAVTVRLLLYAVLAALAVTGTATMYLSQEFASAHRLLVKLGIGLVGLHTLGAFWHQLVRRDRLIESMLPMTLFRRAGED
jgi:cytochrome b561